MPPSQEKSKNLSSLGKPRLCWARGVDLRGETVAWTLMFGRQDVGEAHVGHWTVRVLSIHESEDTFKADGLEDSALDMAHWFRGLGFSIQPLPIDVSEGP